MENKFTLPEKFRDKMKKLLGEEYSDFVESYENKRVHGLRVNTLKEHQEAFEQKMPFTLHKIPWAKEGYYYQNEERPGKHPYHEAGLYYIQEPSAMAVVELLDPKPGEMILDLCAAPGGKTTHAAERLQQKGLLVSNEIHPARAKILSQNVERMGISNAIVTNEDSARLLKYFPEFFDGIIVDAPCSGEGMFRKDEGAVNEWSEDHVKLCSMRQAEILDNAAGMLKAGGRMVYSTCTFSPEENEESIENFLKRHPEFSIKQTSAYEGFSKGHPEWIDGGRKELKDTFRLWPHKLDGEGHYMAVLEKKEDVAFDRKRKTPIFLKDKNILEDYRKFVKETITDPRFAASTDRIVLFGDQMYLLPEGMVSFDGLKVLRPGLHLGTVKKNRFEPSHALALFLKKEQVEQWYDLSADQQDTMAYLKGEALLTQACLPKEEKLAGKGWVLMLVDGYSIGWAKLTGGILKNHYPKGLRIM